MWVRVHKNLLTSIAGGCVAVLLACAVPVGAQQTPWNAFSATMTITRVQLGADRRPVAVLPPASRFRLERWQSGTLWKSALTLQSTDQIAVQSGTDTRVLRNPFQIARIEYAGDGTPPTLFNARGQVVSTATTADVQRLVIPGVTSSPLIPSRTVGAPVVRSDAWIDQVILTPEKKTLRRQALVQSLGSPVANVNGIEYFVSTRADLSCWVHVAAATAAVVEVNCTRRGQFASRTTQTYDTLPSGAVIRRLLRTEMPIPGRPSERSTTDVELTNPSFTMRVTQ
jgi:hypothetical protein